MTLCHLYAPVSMFVHFIFYVARFMMEELLRSWLLEDYISIFEGKSRFFLKIYMLLYFLWVYYLNAERFHVSTA